MKEQITSLFENEKVTSILPNLFCMYCHKKIDEDREPYSVMRNEIGIFAWHYMCYDRHNNEVIAMSTKSKMGLCKHLMELHSSGRQDGWIVKVLNSCGYKV